MKLYIGKRENACHSEPVEESKISRCATLTRNDREATRNDKDFSTHSLRSFGRNDSGKSVEMTKKSVEMTMGRRIATLLLGIFMIFGAVFGAAGLFNGNYSGLNAGATANTTEAAKTYTITGDDGKFDKKAMRDLIKVLGTASGAGTTSNYKALDKGLTEKNTTEVKASSLNGFVVKFAGYTWNAVYLSRAAYGATDSAITANYTTSNKIKNNAVGDSGDLILTLWLADVITGQEQEAVQWNNWYGNNSTGEYSNSWTYPSAMYSSSYIRSYLNGGFYAKSSSGGAITTDNTTATYNKAHTTWSTITDKYGDYLSTPEQVEWQKTQNSGQILRNSTSDIWNSGYLLKNDAWGNIESGTGANKWYSAAANYYSKRGSSTYLKTQGDVGYDMGYDAWKNDKLWLPSLSETGWNANSAGGANTYTGYWGLTYQQRANSQSKNSWLRSGRCNGGNRAYCLSVFGSNYDCSANDTYAVRPALHLNLKSAASAAGVELPTAVENTPKYNSGNKVKILENIDENIVVDKVTVKTTHRDNTTETYTLATSEYEVKDGAFYAARAGAYTVTFKLQPAAGSDLTIWNGTDKDDDGYPTKKLNGEFLDVLYWEIPQSGSTDPIWTTDNQNVAGTVIKAKPTVTSVSYAGTNTLYSGGALPELAFTSSTPGALTLDAGQTLVEGKNPYNWTFRPTDDENYNDECTGTVELDVKKPELVSLEAAFDRASYVAAVAAGTAKKVFSSTTLDGLKEIIKDYITITTADKENGDPFDEPELILEGFTLEYMAGKTELESGNVEDGGKNNDVMFCFGGVKHKLAAGAGIPVYTVDLVSIAVTSAPQTRQYTALTEFSKTGMVVTATYTDGDTKIVPQNNYDVIHNDGHDELWYGDTSVTITYTKENELKKEFTATTTYDGITVTQITIFVNQFIFEDAEKDYTGSPQNIELVYKPNGTETAIPLGVTTEFDYEKGEGATAQACNAEDVVDVLPNGERYLITLHLDLKKTDDDGNRYWGVNYRYSGTPQKSAYLKILPVKYDGVENITFADGTAQYSASTKVGSLTVKNLPAGDITVAYEYYSDEACTEANKLTDEQVVNMGDYWVKAIFTVDINHKPIDFKKAKMTIIPHVIVKEEISGIERTYEYKGEKWEPKPTVTVTLGGNATELTEGDDKDYTVAYSTDAFVAGTEVTVTVTGKGNFSGSVDITFTITKATLKLTWAGDGHENCVYNGSAHFATITVDADSVFTVDKNGITTETLAALISGGTAAITYNRISGGNSAIVAAGEYKPQFSGYPENDEPWSNYNYEFTNPSFTFVVGEAVLPEITFEDDTVTYDGELHFLYISVDGERYSSATLCNNEVEVKYYFDALTDIFVGRRNVATTPYRVRAEIKLKTNNYDFTEDIVAAGFTVSEDKKSATKYAFLTIAPKAIGENDEAVEGVTLEGINAAYDYCGTEITPAISLAVVLKEGAEAKPLVAENDYKVTYSGDRLNASVDGSVVTVTVSGFGNYSGAIVKTFRINKIGLSLKWIGNTDHDDAHYTYTGAAQGVTAQFEGVAERDKETVVPEVYYLEYEEYIQGNYTTIDMPVNAGRYVVAVRLTDEHKSPNYNDFSDQYEFFNIVKAKPTVGTPAYVSYNGGELFVGQHLPEITKSTATLNENIPDVEGSVSWKLVDGVVPVLKLNSNEYVWVFTPEDTDNLEAVEGVIRLQANEPTFASMTVKWNTEDGLQPFLWSSTTLEDLRKYITVTATLTNGADFGEVTEQYSLSGSWGEAASPKLGGYDDTTVWDISVALQSLPQQKFENVQYNFVTLDYLEIEAADGGEINKNYNALTKFDTESINVVAYFKDGSKQENISGYKLIYQQTDERLWFGNTAVTVSYTYRGTTETATVSGLIVRKIVFATTDIIFENTPVSMPYDGETHTLALSNEDKFTIGEIAYKILKKNADDEWVALDGVSEVKDAGEYRVDATFTIKDDPTLGDGVYTNNYTLDAPIKRAYLTIKKVKYAGADDIAFASTASAVYNGGDTVNLYTDAIKAAATGVSEEVWGIASFEYSLALNSPVLPASEAVHAGSYIVTVIFDVDDNHEEISSRRINLTVAQADPIRKPQLNGHPLKGMSINEITLLNGEDGTAGYFTWVSYGNFNPENYILHTGTNTVYYTFTPDNTRDYKTIINVAYTITAKDNYPIRMYATVVQGDTELFTSYTLERLLSLAADESEDLTISVYMIFNDGTEDEVRNYDVVLASGNEYLDRDENGRCYLVFTYELEGETFEYTKAYVTVHTNGLGSIEAIFVQNGVEIFTSGDINTIYGLLADEDSGVSLTVNSYYADGDFKAELTADEYTLSGDWSGLTADGSYNVAVTASVNGETASTTFGIDVTLVILTEITVDFDQNGKSVYASDDITVLEAMISGGEVSLTVTAHYNDTSENVISFGANGYTVSIASALFEVGQTEVTVLYGEGGIDKNAAFNVDVTAVLVVRLYAKITAVNQIIYTDTSLNDLAGLLSVTAYYNDGTEQTEISDYSLVMPDGSEKLVACTQVAVNVNYTGADIADYFEAYMLVLGVVKHNTDITFGGKTVYTYDGMAHDINDGATTNHEDDEALTYEIDGAAARIMSAKDYTLVITSAETDDYYAATLTVNITVNKADYDMSEVKLESNTVVYSGNKQYLLVSGSLPMNVYIGGYSYVYGENEVCEESSATNAGVYTVTVTFRALDTDNYNEIPDMTATLTIEKAEAEVDDSGMFATAYEYSGEEQTVTGATIKKADDGADIVYVNNTFTKVPAGGKLAVQITVAEGVNYKAFNKTVEISISKAALTVTAQDNEITYGEKPADGGVSCEGFVNEETVENLAGELAYAFDYSQYGNVGEYVISISGVSSENYEITFVAGKLTVNQAEAEVVWNAQNCVYDGKAHNPTATFTDLFGTAIALTVTVNYANGGYAGEAISAGDYVASAASLNPNYMLTGTTCKFTIIADTDDWIRFDFRKDYIATYGSVPETAEELAALAELLVNQSYVRVDYNAGGAIADLDTVIRLMTVRLEADENTPVTAKTPVGRYNICFEFKPEYADTYATYTVYQTFEKSENTNLGRLVIQPRKLTLDWGDTEFKFDGNAHLLTATAAGFIDGETPVTFTMTEKGGEFSFEVDGTTVKFSLAVSGDFTSVGGHTVTASVDNANYTIANPYVTASIGSGPEKLSTLSWILIAVAAACFVAMIIAFVVASNRRPRSGGGGYYDDEDGFNDLYYGE